MKALKVDSVFKLRWMCTSVQQLNREEENFSSRYLCADAANCFSCAPLAVVDAYWNPQHRAALDVLAQRAVNADGAYRCTSSLSSAVFRSRQRRQTRCLTARKDCSTLLGLCCQLKQTTPFAGCALPLLLKCVVCSLCRVLVIRLLSILDPSTDI